MAEPIEEEVIIDENNANAADVAEAVQFHEVPLQDADAVSIQSDIRSFFSRSARSSEDAQSIFTNTQSESTANNGNDNIVERHERRRKRKATRMHNCWLCGHGKSGPDRVYWKEYNQLINIIQDGLHAGKEITKIAEELHMYQKTYIYEPMRKNKLKCKLLSYKMALDHLEEHVIDPRVVIIESIKMVRKMKKKMSSKIFKIMPTSGHEHIDHKAGELFLKLIDAESKLYSKDPKRMVAFDENLHVADPAKFGMVAKHLPFEDQPITKRQHFEAERSETEENSSYVI